MKVYLVQHGESKSEIEDPDRPLTEKGKETVASVARYLASLGMEVAEILHSDRLRARQTAELFAQHLSPARGAKEEKWLGPLDDPQKARRLIQQAEGPLMIIGHLPHLSRLASLLILGTPENEIIRFKMGGVVCLSKSDSKWFVEWVLVPELIHK
ncbi:phosphohistidine phosphatase SixA [Dehalococcoidia bacterium]|nr:phosphohistidine phosphatase SixA [Dehalococcoidia bacterium]